MILSRVPFTELEHTRMTVLTAHSYSDSTASDHVVESEPGIIFTLMPRKVEFSRLLMLRIQAYRAKLKAQKWKRNQSSTMLALLDP